MNPKKERLWGLWVVQSFGLRVGAFFVTEKLTNDL